MKRCMYCGQLNDDASTSCANCGNQLLDIPVDSQNGMPAVPDAAEAGQNVDDIQIQDVDSMSMQEAEADVHRGQTYAAQQQYSEGSYGQQYGGQDYGYEAQAAGQQQYGGQAYGYRQDAGPYQGQPYGYQQNAPQYSEEQGYYDQRPAQPAGSNQILKKSRRRVKSFLSFLCLLFLTVGTVGSILNVALGNALTNIFTVSNTITNMVGRNTAVNFMNSSVQMLNGINPLYLKIGGLVALIPAVFFTLGLWIAFVSTTNKYARNSTGGFTLARVAVIFEFIGMCVILLAAIVMAVAFVVAAGASSSMMSLIVGVVLLLIIIILTVCVIMYYIQAIYSLKVVRTNVKTGMDIGRIPGFFIFAHILGCALIVLSMLPMAPDDYIGLIATGARAAWLLFSALWAIIYRATVKPR